MSLHTKNIRDRIIAEVQDILDREFPAQESGISSRRAAAPASSGPFLDLQNGFYNALCQGLGLSPNTFQILQPSPPLPDNSNTELWKYFNNIPPFSLTQNYISSGGNRFFDDYKGLIGALKPTKDIDFKGDIGTDVFNAWLAYVSNLKPLPAPTQQPQIFLNWASIFYPDVANVGAADLSAMLLDPITSAGMALMPYADPTHPLPADWSPDYSTLKQMLANAPSISFSFNSKTMDSNVSNTWSQGNDEGFFGLWGSSSSSSAMSNKFAASEITVQAFFDHVLTFAGSPGVWYNSSAMGDAFSHPDAAPWNPKSTLNWTNTFDPQQGNMARFMVNVIVVAGMHVVITAAAEFSAEEQTAISQNSSAGIWPFYSSGSSGGSTTQTSFDQSGRMTVTIDSMSQVATVIGGNILPIERYIGHAVRATHMAQTRSKARA